MNILLLGGRSFVALELARNFGRHGHTVITAESVPVHPAGWSRYASKNFSIASPRFAADSFFNDLCHVIEDESIELLVPTCEETYYIAQLMPSLNSKYPNLQIASASIEHISQLHDKLLCMELCEKLNIKSPRTLPIRHMTDLVKARAQFGDSRILIKPRFSRFGTDIHIIEPSDDLEGIDLEDKEWVCQNYIDGSLMCSYSYASQGNTIATVCYLDPLNKSGEASTVFLPVTNSSAHEAIEKIIKHLGYSGSISFDFILKDDTPYIIECNPRITSGLHCIGSSDLQALMHDKTPLESPITSAQIRLVTVLRHQKWLASFPDVMMRWSDPLPVLSYIWLALHFAKISYHNKISFTAATTHDIEWNGAGESIS